MTTTLAKSSKPAMALRLENGDLLSRDEFERLYFKTPEKVKAELIDGVVFMASPVRMDYHAEPDADLHGWLSNYRMLTKGVRLGVNGSFRMDKRNETQPDAILYLPKTSGGQTEIDEDGFLTGIPELIVEVSHSSKSIDLNSKKRMYEIHGVLEYLVWRVLDGAIDWFILRHNSYHHLAADAEGILRSQTFPGLWLNVPAMLRGDLLEVFATLQKGCATEEHQRYVERIAQTQST